MEKLKKYIKPCIGIGIFMVVYLLIMSILHYFGVMKLSSIGKINFVIMAVLMFVGGILMGKKTSKKGYLEGLKLGSSLVVILLLLNIILFRHFDLYVVLYYIVLVVGSTIGSMIGINMHH